MVHVPNLLHLRLHTGLYGQHQTNRLIVNKTMYINCFVHRICRKGWKSEEEREREVFVPFMFFHQAIASSSFPLLLDCTDEWMVVVVRSRLSPFISKNVFPLIHHNHGHHIVNADY